MQVKLKINGDRWIVKVVSQDELLEEMPDNGDMIAGLCIPSEKTIYIEENNVDYTTVLHELYHAYFSALCLDDTSNLTLLDLEEITANFFCNKASEIIRKAKELTKRLKKGRR